MRGVPVLIAIWAAAAWAQTPDVEMVPTVSSAADPFIGVAPGSLATIDGDGLAIETGASDDSPLPENLGGVRIDVTDSSGVTRPAGVDYVSPPQINFEVPPQTASGAATVIIRAETRKPVRVPVQIQTAAPALFSVGAGIASATAARVSIPSKVSTPASVYSCVNPETCALVPLNLGPNSNLDLTLRATGLDSIPTSDVKVNIAGRVVQPDFAGPDAATPGLDDVRFAVPFDLRDAGEVGIYLIVGNASSNTVKISLH